VLQGILFALLAAVMWTGNAYAYATVARRGLPVIPFYALACSLGTISAAAQVHWGILLGGQASHLPALMAVMLACGLANAGAMILILNAFACGHSAITWTFSQMAMVLYFLFSLLFWGESASGMQWAGLAVILVALAMLAPSGAANDGPRPGARGRWLALIVPAFFLLGGAQILFIVPSHWHEGDPARLRSTLLLAIAALVGAGLAVVLRQRIRRAMLAPALLMAVCSSLGLAFVTASGNRLAAAGHSSLVYPISTAGSVILFAPISCFVLKEQFSTARWLGLAFAIAGVVMLSVR